MARPADAAAMMLGAWLVLSAGLAPGLAMEPPPDPGPGPRPELHRPGGQPALLSLPPAATAPVPAVLVLHDAFGPDARSEPYIAQLLGAGIAVLDLLAEAGEAAGEAALALLAADPRIDPARLGVLGFGAGAAAALRAPVPARALLYPGCGSLPRGTVPPGAVLLAYGGADAANPTVDCAAIAAALAKAGLRIRRAEYPGAGYGWDRPPFATHERALVLRPGGGTERVLAEPWPALARLVAAQLAGFFAMAFAP